MSAETAQLLAAFETLPAEEQQVFVKELFRRLPPYDSGPLEDDEVARAGDELAAMLEREEYRHLPNGPCYSQAGYAGSGAVRRR